MALRAVAAKCVIRLQSIAKLHGSTFIKTVGNSRQMWTFPDTREAWCAVLDMRTTANDEFDDIQFKAGFQFGSVIQEPGDVNGDSVNSAARLADLANLDQIFTSGDTLSRLGPSVTDEFRYVDEVRVKGKAEVMEAFEALGEEDDITVMGSVAQRARAMGSVTLKLEFIGGERLMSSASPSLSIGKADENDIVIADTSGLVSRTAHVAIEFIGKGFTFTDRSTNGTSIHIDGGNPEFLRREQGLLRGSGRIILGAEPEPFPETVLHYTVNDTAPD